MTRVATPTIVRSAPRLADDGATLSVITGLSGRTFTDGMVRQTVIDLNNCPMQIARNPEVASGVWIPLLQFQHRVVKIWGVAARATVSFTQFTSPNTDIEVSFLSESGNVLALDSDKLEFSVEALGLTATTGANTHPFAYSSFSGQQTGLSSSKVSSLNPTDELILALSWADDSSNFTTVFNPFITGRVFVTWTALPPENAP